MNADMAQRRLRSFVAVGIAERLPESLRLIARALGAADPPLFGRRNVATNRPAAIDHDTIRIIRACTEVDSALYASQRRSFEEAMTRLDA
jgi:hypothetical protein